MPRLIPPELGNGWRPGDSRQGPGTVPVLDVADDTHESVGAAHDAALDPKDDTTLLAGAIIYFDNKRPRDPSPVAPPGTPEWTMISIGGSTLHEAVTEVISCVGDQALDMPAWVASTDKDLATVVAEHFTVNGYSTCKVIKMSEVSQ